jgi:hypothetical protein
VRPYEYAGRGGMRRPSIVTKAKSGCLRSPVPRSPACGRETLATQKACAVTDDLTALTVYPRITVTRTSAYGAGNPRSPAFQIMHCRGARRAPKDPRRAPAEGSYAAPRLQRLHRVHMYRAQGSCFADATPRSPTVRLSLRRQESRRYGRALAASRWIPARLAPPLLRHPPPKAGSGRGPSMR